MFVPRYQNEGFVQIGVVFGIGAGMGGGLMWECTRLKAFPVPAAISNVTHEPGD